ncbi:MAG TPA: hypothetical protein VFN50_12435 [Acidimicrobiales bacterium]|nr:hypothetical protein [Acidimicrobiales bacterium]
MPDSAVLDLSSIFIHLGPGAGVRPRPGATRLPEHLEPHGSGTEPDAAGERLVAGPLRAVIGTRVRWHTPDATEPGGALTLTPGFGTQRRPPGGR